MNETLQWVTTILTSGILIGVIKVVFMLGRVVERVDGNEETAKDHEQRIRRLEAAR